MSVCENELRNMRQQLNGNSIKKNIDCEITACIFNLKTNVNEVRGLLLDDLDCKDIENNLVPRDNLKLHIELWILADKPNRRRSL